MAPTRDFLLGVFFLFAVPPSLIVGRVHGYVPGLSLSRKEIAGIWRLSCKLSFLPRLMVHCTSERNAEEDEDILLSLNEDGSFVQYDDVEEEVTKERIRTAIKGTWNFNEGELVLAIDRQRHNNILKANDTIISGTIVTQSNNSLLSNPTFSTMQDNGTSTPENEGDVYLSIPKGKLLIGKFTYPKHHPSFFDQPILQSQTKGFVKLHQVLGLLNTQCRGRTRTVEAERAAAAFHETDFHGRKFLLASVPLQPARQSSELSWNRKKIKYGVSKKVAEDSFQQPIDIRIMPIEFFTNNTFSVYGFNKILRGRFGITFDNKDQLWFQVSLFGAGRTAPGSVYSEGNGLTHEDRRSYLGNIVCQRGQEGGKSSTTSKKIFVEGSVFVGSDLGSDARPEPVAHFTMREVSSLSSQPSGSDADSDSEESVFE